MDFPELPAGEALDNLCEAVFDGPDGRARLDPLVEQFDASVGVIRQFDDQWPLWQAIRTDWALCEATVPGGQPGETWAFRLAAGRVSGLIVTPEERAVADSIAGLFEVFRAGDGRRPRVIVRNALTGLVVELAEPLEGLAEGTGALALWETRVVLLDDGAHLCRPPLVYPLALASALDPFSFGPELALAKARAARLAWARSGERADISHLFRSLMAVAHKAAAP